MLGTNPATINVEYEKKNARVYEPITAKITIVFERDIDYNDQQILNIVAYQYETFGIRKQRYKLDISDAIGSKEVETEIEIHFRSYGQRIAKICIEDQEYKVCSPPKIFNIEGAAIEYDVRRTIDKILIINSEHEEIPDNDELIRLFGDDMLVIYEMIPIYRAFEILATYYGIDERKIRTRFTVLHTKPRNKILEKLCKAYLNNRLRKYVILYYTQEKIRIGRRRR